MFANIFIIANILLVVNMTKEKKDYDTPPKETPPQSEKKGYKRISKVLSTGSKEQEKKKRRELVIARQKEKRQAIAASLTPEALQAKLFYLEEQLHCQGNIIANLTARLSALEETRKGPTDSEVRIPLLDFALACSPSPTKKSPTKTSPTKK